MASVGVTLLEDEDALGTSGWVYFQGGRTVLTIQATTYPTTTTLELMGPDGNKITVSGNLTTAGDAIVVYDLPPGSYRIVRATGTCTDMYARLNTVNY